MPRTSAAAWLLPSAALVAGVLGVVAVWVVVAVASGRPCSWMALLAALDVALLARIAGIRAGPRRVLVAVVATIVAVLLAQWLLVATQMGIALGLQPLASALRLGPALALQLLELNLHRADYALMLAALPLAAWLALPSRSERVAAERAKGS